LLEQWEGEGGRGGGGEGGSGNMISIVRIHIHFGEINKKEYSVHRDVMQNSNLEQSSAVSVEVGGVLKTAL
jgi:hypothetical protein